MYKIVVSFVLLFSVSVLSAQTKYEKEFITLVKTMEKDGNITSLSKVGCIKGDCFITGLVVESVGEESGEKSLTSVELFKVKDVKNYITFKEGNGAMKEGEKRSFALELTDIKTDGHNYFFDKNKMKKEFGEKSEVYRYFKKYLDASTDGAYRLSMQKINSDVVMQDSGNLNTGSFLFGMNNRYTIKGGFEKLEELSNTNPMGALSYIVINSIAINIENPKGFLRNLLYITYESEMKEATSKEERVAVNSAVLLEGDTVHSKKEFHKMIRQNAKKRIQEMAANDPEFNKLLNVNGQLEKKVDAILAGTSKSILIKIENKHGLSLGDFFGIFMGYAMQQKLAAKPDITITIK